MSSNVTAKNQKHSWRYKSVQQNCETTIPMLFHSKQQAYTAWQIKRNPVPKINKYYSKTASKARIWSQIWNKEATKLLRWY